MIETYLLEQFVAVAKCGTLLKASEELHISQPSLSRSMRKLEEILEVSLFERNNSKITLNETGRIAAEYAERALDANQELIERVVAFDRSLRTINIGSCAPFPLIELMPALQERLPGKTITAEITTDDKLITGLKNRTYSLVILHDDPDDRSLFCQHYIKEQLYLSIGKNHRLAKRKGVSFKDLTDLKILINENIGFWMDVTLQKLPPQNLIIQRDFDSFSELVNASNLPFFNSDQYIARGYVDPDRISVPITDKEASATYCLCCLLSEQSNYRSLFNAARGKMLIE